MLEMVGGVEEWKGTGVLVFERSLCMQAFSKRELIEYHRRRDDATSSTTTMTLRRLYATSLRFRVMVTARRRREIKWPTVRACWRACFVSVFCV